MHLRVQWLHTKFFLKKVVRPSSPLQRRRRPRRHCDERTRAGVLPPRCCSNPLRELDGTSRFTAGTKHARTRGGQNSFFYQVKKSL